MATPLPAADAMWTLLQILTDADASAERLRALQAETATLEARIREVGVVGEIESLQARARADRQMAEESLALAKKASAELKTDALKARAAVTDDLAAQRLAFADERQAFTEAVGQAAREAQAREAQLTQRESEVAARAADAAQQLREAQAIRAEFETRLERLKAATAAA